MRGPRAYPCVAVHPGRCLRELTGVYALTSAPHADELTRGVASGGHLVSLACPRVAKLPARAQIRGRNKAVLPRSQTASVDGARIPRTRVTGDRKRRGAVTRSCGLSADVRVALLPRITSSPDESHPTRNIVDHMDHDEAGTETALSEHRDRLLALQELRDLGLIHDDWYDVEAARLVAAGQADDATHESAERPTPAEARRRFSFFRRFVNRHQ